MKFMLSLVYKDGCRLILPVKMSLITAVFSWHAMNLKQPLGNNELILIPLEIPRVTFTAMN